MGDDDALGLAGAARRVDDVGGVVRGDGDGWCARVLAREGVLAGVEAHDVRALGQQAQEGVLGEQHAGAAVLEHEGQALARVVRGQRHVGGAGLEDAEQAHHHVGGALHAERDAVARANAPAQQETRELVGARVQLPVGEACVVGLHGQRIRSAPRLCLDALVDACVAREVRGGGVPLHQDLVPLRFRQQGDGAQRGLGPGDQGFHQHAEVLGHPRGGGAVEQVGVVAELTPVAVLELRQAQLQVELDGAVVHLQRAQGEFGTRLGAGGGLDVLQCEADLEERSATPVPLGTQLLYQSLEGHVLVGVGTHGRLPHLLEQLAEGLAAAHLGAQHQRVDEEADEAFQLATLTSSDGRAHADVLLPRVAREQGLPGGQQHHERGDALALAERLERLGQGSRQVDGKLAAMEGLHRWARLVGGELQRRGAREVAAPVAELGIEHLRLQPLALPDGVVGVLHR